jgi:type IV secretion system protein VirD4
LLLDNYRVPVALALNYDCIAGRVSDARSTAIELCATKNDAGPLCLSRLSRLTLSRHGTIPLFLGSGEVIQLPLSDGFILVSGIAPIRAHQARNFNNRRHSRLTLPPLALKPPSGRLRRPARLASR